MNVYELLLCGTDSIVEREMRNFRVGLKKCKNQQQATLFFEFFFFFFNYSLRHLRHLPPHN